MFGNKVENEATEDREDAGRGIGLAHCAGSQAFAVVGRKLRVMSSGGPGMTVQADTLPLPGRVVAVGAGPSVVTADGTLWWWHPMGKEWQRVGNLLDEPKR